MSDINKLFADMAKNQSSTKVEEVSGIQNLINKQNLSWKAKETKVSKLPPAKQKKILGLDSTPKEVEAEEKATAKAEAKAKTAAVKHGKGVDWRNNKGKNWMTRAWAQGNCNACVSFSTVAAVEANLRIQKNNPNIQISLSEAHPHYCRPNGSCERPWGLSGCLQWARDTGLASDDDFQWSENGKCAQLRKGWENNAWKIKDYGTHRTADERKAAIDQGPVVAGMYMFSDFFAYGGGVYVKTKDARPIGGHAIVICGYDDDKGYWIIKNSMGRSWGEDGFGYIAYGQPELKLDNAYPFYSVGEVYKLK